MAVLLADEEDVMEEEEDDSDSDSDALPPQSDEIFEAN